jgi:hypothetical protein
MFNAKKYFSCIVNNTNKTITTRPGGYFKPKIIIPVYYNEITIELNKEIVNKLKQKI